MGYLQQNKHFLGPPQAFMLASCHLLVAPIHGNGAAVARGVQLACARIPRYVPVRPLQGKGRDGCDAVLSIDKVNTVQPAVGGHGQAVTKGAWGQTQRRGAVGNHRREG
jgi:hypothetical protein